MNRNLHFFLLAFFCGLVFLRKSASADSVQLNSEYRGYYNSDGSHASNNANYQAGDVGNGNTPLFSNDFFTFDLNGIQGRVVSANLVLYEPSNGFTGYGEVAPYSVYDVGTSTTDLTASHSAGTAGQDIYNDLGSGAKYGSANVAVGGNYNVTVPLNNQFLSDLNNRTGNLFSVGGSAKTNPGFVLFYQDAHANSADGLTRLELTTVPVPLPPAVWTTLAILGSATGVRILADWKSRRLRSLDLVRDAERAFSV